MILEKTTPAEKEMLLSDYDDRLASYVSHFRAYRTWLDEDVWGGLVLTTSMEDWFSADIVDFEQAHQMCTFLRDRYEPTGQCTFVAAIRQEQLLRLGDATVDDFFAQLFAVCRQIDTLGPQLSSATYQSCKDQKAALELRHTYDFLT
jgi:hypothetical protein